METNLTTAVNYVEQKGESVEYSGIVQEISGFESAQDLILVITKNYLFVFNTNPFNIMSEHPWQTILGLSHTSHNVQLRFNSNKYVCFTTEVSKIIDALTNVLPATLTANQLSKIGFMQSKKELILPRLTLLSLKENIVLSSKTKEILDEISQSLRSSMSTSEFPDHKESLMFLIDSLSVLPCLRCISFDTIEDINIYQTLCMVFDKSKSIECLKINGKAHSSAFHHFLSKYRDYQSNSLQGFVFSNSEFREEHLRWLSNILVKKHVRSLGFQNAFKSDMMKYFCTSFLNSEIGDNLAYLNLDRTLGVKISLILPYLPSIQYLSLEECGLDVGEVLSIISNFKLSKLVGLNLSSNKCSKQLGSYKIVFPSSLETLMIDNIKWEGDSLKQMLAFIFNNFKNGVRLSISKTFVTEEQWNSVFSLLQKTQYTNVCALVWNRNPTNSVFFNFLRRNKNLTYLSLNSCFSERNRQKVDQLINYLSSANLYSLSICGTKHHFLGSLIPMILKEDLKLDFLDISGNYCGVYLASQPDLMTNLQIGTLVFDGNFTLTQPKAVFSLFEKISESETRISCPIKDIREFLDRGFISEEMADDMKQMFTTDKLYIEEDEPLFATYIKKEDINNEKDNNIKPGETDVTHSKRLFELNHSTQFINTKSDDPDNKYSECLIKSDESDDLEIEKKPVVETRHRHRHHHRRSKNQIEISVSTDILNKEPEVVFGESISPRKRNSSVPTEKRISFSIPELPETDDYEPNSTILDRSAVATVGDTKTIGFAGSEKETPFLPSPAPIARPSRVEALRKHTLNFTDSGSDHFDIEEEEEVFKENIINNSDDSSSNSDLGNMQTLMIVKQQEKPVEEKEKGVVKLERNEKIELKETKEDIYDWDNPVNHTYIEEETEEMWETAYDNFSFENVFKTFSKIPSNRK